MNIFISYAKEDREQAEAVAKALGSLGWQVFWDRDIPPGKTWDEVIEKAIEAAGCMLVLWTRSSVASEWVRAEAEEGLNRDILIPVLIEEARIPLRFRPVQAASLVDWREDPSHPGFRQLVQAIAEIIGAPPPREKQEATPSELEEEIAKPPETVRPKPEPIEARIVEARMAEPQPSEPKPDTAKPPGMGPAARLGVLIALAVVVVAGAIWLFQQKPTKPGPEISAPQVKPEEPRKAPEPAVKAPAPEVKAPDTKAAAPEVKPETPVETKPSVTSTPKKFTNSIGMEFVLIPAGSFTMGSSTGDKDEQPPHDVKISQSFYLQTTEVTQGQWKQVRGDNPSKFNQCGDDCPVENVSWEDAKRFIEKLNRAEKTQVYRLPSEAEWEYACRAGTTTDYSFGNDAGELGEYAWYSGNSKDRTQRVAGKEPNSWGLYDMHGNVWEWVEDDYHDSYNRAPADGRAWVEKPRGSNGVLRGGSWLFGAAFCRSANRSGNSPVARRFDLGFRVSRSVALGP